MDSRRCISRIDQPHKRNHGYYVRVTHEGQIRASKFFADKKSGGKTKALALATQYRDLVVSALPHEHRARLEKPRRKIPQSGVTGVTHVVQTVKCADGTLVDYRYWQARWTDPKTRKSRTRKFLIHKLGNAKALQAAIDFKRTHP